MTSNIERLISKAECAYTGKKPAELMLTVDQGFELLFSLQFGGQMKGYNHLVPDTEVRQTLQSHDESKLRAIFDLVPYNSHKIVIVQSAFPKLREQPQGEDTFWYQRSASDPLAEPRTAPVNPVPTKFAELDEHSLTLNENDACIFGSESAADAWTIYLPNSCSRQIQFFRYGVVLAVYNSSEGFIGWLKK